MNEKERLLDALSGRKTETPVICPGGMMNAGVTEVVKDIRKNHNVNVNAMAEAAIKVHDLTGFENYGVPFCMTCEAEALGATISEGDAHTEPRVTQYVEKKVSQLIDCDPLKLVNQSRMSNVVESITYLKNDKVPVIGNITGPISTASSIIDPLVFLKSMRKSPEEAKAFLEFINAYLIEYAKQMIAAGADVIAMSDPTSTGEILGEKNFRTFTAPLYETFLAEMSKLNTPMIIHICGDANTIIGSLNDLSVNALSFDSIVNMKTAKNKIQTALMGNVNTQLLQNGQADKIIDITGNALRSGVDIVSPACGLGMSTPIENLTAMTTYVKGLR